MGFLSVAVLLAAPAGAQDVTVDDDGEVGTSGGCDNTGTTVPSTIGGGISNATSGDVVFVCPGTYAENVTIDKAITLNGNNNGTAGNDARAAESVVDAGSGIGFDVTTASDVDIDGFEFTGDEGVVLTSDGSSQGQVIVQNSRFLTDERGVVLKNFTAGSGVTVSSNFVDLTQGTIGIPPDSRDQAGSEIGTVGIELRTIEGSGSVSVSSNDFSDGGDTGSESAFYGILFDGVKPSSRATISGGSIQGTAQAIAILDGQEGRQLEISGDDSGIRSATQSPDESFFEITGMSASNFTGSSTTGAISLHAGVFVFTGGSPSSTVTSDGQIANVTMTGTGTANGTGNSSAGLYFGGFSTEFGNGNFDQSVTVTEATVQDNDNRGIYAHGADVTVTVEQSTITGNGDNATISNNPGIGVLARADASLTVTQSTITNPSSLEGGTFGSTLQSQRALSTGPVLTVRNCKIDRNGDTAGTLFSGSEEVRAAENAFVDGMMQLNGSEIAGNTSGSNNDFNPYLTSPSDTDGSTAGFQGDFSGMTVTTRGDQLQSFGTNQRIADGIGSVNADGTVTVEAGTFSETVSVGKSVALKGNNAGTAGSGSRSAETVVDAGTTSPVDRTNEIAFTVREDDVTVNGFQLMGNYGVVLDPGRFSATNDGVGLTVSNNLVTTDVVGVDVRNVTTTGSRSFTLADNQFEIQRQFFDLNDTQEQNLGGDADNTDGDEVFEYTAAVSLRTIDGDQAPTVSDNVVRTDGTDGQDSDSDPDGSFYGYALDAVNVSSGATTIGGGSVQGVAQGVAVLDGQSNPQSTLTLQGISLSNFNGDAPNNNGVNHQSGVFVYTTGGDRGNGSGDADGNSGTTTVSVDNVSVDGTEYVTDFSAGLNFSGFGDTDDAQSITVTNSTVQNCANRGLLVSGFADTDTEDTKVDVTVGGGTVIENNGSTASPDDFGVISEYGGDVTLNDVTVTASVPSDSDVAEAIHVRDPQPGEIILNSATTINAEGQLAFGGQGGDHGSITLNDGATIDAFRQEGLGSTPLNVASAATPMFTGTAANTDLVDLTAANVTIPSDATIGLGSGTHEAASDLSLANVETQNTGSGGPALLGSGVLRVTNLLRLASGTFDVSGGTLTLPSTSESDVGYIAGSGTGTVTGDVTMERYIDKTDDAAHFRFLSSPFPVYLDDAGTAGNSVNLLSNVNTQVTGSGANFSVAEENASVFTFDESVDVSDDQFASLSEGWNDVQNLNDAPITPGNGYLVYLFRKNGGAGPNGFPITLSVTGSVPTSENDGTDQAPVLSFTNNDPDSGGDASPDDLDGWNLIANPFAAPIDWESIESSLSNVDATVYVLAADGTYAEYTAEAGGGTNGTSTNGGSRYIAPFQAFFVKATGSSPDLSITSDDKTGGQSPAFKNAPATSPKESGSDSPRIVLELRTEDGRRSETTAVTFTEEAKAGKDAYDAYQLSPFASTYAQLATTMEGTDALFAQQNRPVPGSTTTIGIAKDITADGSYVLSAKTMEGLPDGWNVILEDVSTGERYDLRAGEQVRFVHSEKADSTRKKKAMSGTSATLSDLTPTVKTGGASTPAYRLQVGTGASLPVEWAGFSGHVDGPRATLTWKTLSETNNAGFAVQHKGPDAASFQRIGYVEGHGTTTQTHRYRYGIEELPVGKHTFRLRQVDTDGRATFSNERTLSVALQQHHVVKPVSPNPIQHRGTLKFATQEADPVTVTLYNALGQRVQVLYRGIPEPDSFTSVPVRADDLASGAYFVRVRGGDFVETRRVSIVR